MILSSEARNGVLHIGKQRKLEWGCAWKGKVCLLGREGERHRSPTCGFTLFRASGRW